MLIYSLRLENFLSFGASAEAFELRPLNVLIGPNGSGKSNLIEAIALLRAAPDDMDRVVRAGGGVGSWIWRGAEKGAIATLECISNSVGASPLRHRIAFTESARRFQIHTERVENRDASPGQTKPFFYFGYEAGRPMLSVSTTDGPKRRPRELRREDIQPDRSILAQRSDPDSYPEITALAHAYRGIRIYRDWTFGRSSPARNSQRADLRSDWLEESGENLGLVLNQIRLNMPAHQRLLSGLRKLFDGIDDLHVAVDSGSVQIFLQERGWSIPATRLSDGTLRYLALLAILCHPEPPKLICIEEPELGLHPDVLPFLTDLLIESSSKTQLVVTTHSETIVDGLRDTPESIVVCERDQGVTTLHRPDPARLRDFLTKYSPAQLWRDGHLGGNRW